MARVTILGAGDMGTALLTPLHAGNHELHLWGTAHDRAIVEALEGGWDPERLVVLEFESMERLREWYDSPEYAPLKRLRGESAATQFVIVEGI